MAVEIERKWVAAAPPPAQRLGDGTVLRQGYLARDGRVSVRVRITEGAAWLTVKAGGDGLGRVEVEPSIDRDDAEALWPFTAGHRIDKTRYRVGLENGLVAEVDVFSGDLAELCTVEVEFDSEQAASAFEPPDWFGTEVTGRPEWTNASLAENGRPDG
jgi:adenylate cyclase